ncbi:MAG: thioredoxin domain-containing protein [Bacteroidetes bacterium]|jgi:uncharacterized membrane protein|nr:thioredoxin domain-containing protein [Bacteroidota bacterium]
MLSLSLRSETDIDRIIEVVWRTLKVLGVQAEKKEVFKLLQEHPNANSLLGVHDTLNFYGVDNVAVTLDNDKLKSLDPPFIMYISNKNQFKLITAEENGYLSVEGQHEKEHINNFLDHKDLITILISNTVEQNISTRKSLKSIVKGIMVMFFVVLTTVLIWYILSTGSVNLILSSQFSLMLIFKLLGIMVSWQLLKQQVGVLPNKFVKRICNFNRKTNCDKVLNSKGSKFANLATWSEIGFSYFAGGGICILLAIMVDIRLIQTASLISILVFPYTIFSIVYQWKIAKAWCPLCIIIQVILALEFTVALTFEPSIVLLTKMSILKYLLIFILFMVAAFSFVKAILLATTKKAESENYRNLYKEIKYNSIVFWSLLRSAKIIQNLQDIEDVGMILGNKESKRWILVVYNPFCEYCSELGRQLIDILKSNANIKIQLVFFATDKNSVHASMQMLDIYLAKGSEEAIQYLHHWFNSNSTQAKRQRSNLNNTANQKDSGFEHIEQTRIWAKKEGIEGTPMIYYNGHELPSQYNLKDLTYFIRFS